MTIFEIPNDFIAHKVALQVKTIEEWETALSSKDAASKWLANEGYDEDTSVKDAISENFRVVEYEPRSPRPWLPMAPTVAIDVAAWLSYIEPGWVRLTVVGAWEVVIKDILSPNVGHQVLLTAMGD